MSRILAWLANPILARELRARFRGTRAFGMLTLFVLIEVGLFFVIFANQAYSLSWDVNDPGAPSLGRRVFDIFSAVLVFLVGISTPAAAAAAIVSEREKRTLEFLELTLLGPLEIVAGKLAAALLYVAVLGATALPIVSLVFVLGGVSPKQIFALYAMLALLALAFGTVGIWFSSWCGSTSSATGLSYVAIGLLMPVWGELLEHALRRSTGNWSRLVVPSVPWFGLKLMPLFVVAVPVLLFAHVAVQHAAGRLANREHEPPVGERLSLWLAFTGALLLYAGLAHPTQPIAGSGFTAYVIAETVLLLAVAMAAPVTRETRRERALGAGGAVRRLFSPRAAFLDPVLGLPAFVLLLCLTAAAMHAGMAAATGMWNGDFAVRCVAMHGLVAAISGATMLALTAGASFFECVLPVTPVVIRLLAAVLFIWVQHGAEYLDLSRERYRGGALPWPAAVLVHMSPPKAADAMALATGVDRSRGGFSSSAVTSLAPFPGQNVPGYVGSGALYGMLGLLSIGMIAILHRRQNESS